jgi:hypothetical protein
MTFGVFPSFAVRLRSPRSRKPGLESGWGRVNSLAVLALHRETLATGEHYVSDLNHTARGTMSSPADKAVKFHCDVLGLKLKFDSPRWSKFATGETTFALHPASDKNPAGKVELGFTVADVEAFLPRHERQRRAVHYAAEEARFR